MNHDANASATSISGFTPAQARAFYPDDISLREARERYFRRAGFSAETYVEPCLHLPVGKLVVRLPNLKARRDAVRVHDLNHILGGFGTDWLGEAMVGGFELGMGAGHYWIGWMLDASALTIGLVRAPRAVLGAFARGRAARASTFRVIPDVSAPAYDAVLDGTVGEFRALIGAPDDADITATDVLKLAVYAVGGWFVFPLVASVAVATAVYGLVTPAPAA